MPPVVPPAAPAKASPPAAGAGAARRELVDPRRSTSRTTSGAVTGGAWAGPVRPPVVSPRSVERFAERARARRVLARRQVAAVVGGTAAVGALVWLLLLSSVLALEVDEVVVDGAGAVVAVDAVMAAVQPYDGTPLPRLDTVALRDHVLDVPGVREAKVTRVWPHGLKVVLVAREPVAAVPAGAGEAPGFALLDMEGVQVGRVDAAPEGLPVVDVPVGDARTLGAVLEVLEQLPADLLAQVGGVSAQTQDTVTMTLRDGVRVDWGSAQDTGLKVAVLSALRASPSTTGATVFDVSAPTLPITR
ncbi:cell division protein FtsQ/DivIB [Cellulomonas soli]|uniref:cell division protein FtsQ/DivIB n=1 Tax=Cellulomonas soli TaxID=931535 RepID=UPI003F851704